MTDPSPKAVIARWVALYNEPAGLAAMPDLFADDAVSESTASANGPARTIVGKEAQAKRISAFASTFRDWSFAVHETVAEGERVAIRYTWRAICTEPLGGFGAGTVLRIDGTTFFTVQDGLIVRSSDVAGPMLKDSAREQEGA